ncbi:MAG: hypothetical protein WDO14_15510 [Bacteroidota bacterium]
MTQALPTTTRHTRPVAIFYEHPVWFQPLFDELQKRRIPFIRINAAEHTYNPAEREVPFSILINRVSSSAYRRGNVQGIFQSSRYIAHVERLGIPVLNGTQAQDIEGSKARQLELLASLAMPFPKTRIVNHLSQVIPAAKGLRFPVVIKTSLPVYNTNVRKFDTLTSLERAVSLEQISLGVDHSAIVQEYIESRDNHIVRVETLNGKFLYAVKVFAEKETFNLRPGSCDSEFKVEAYSPPQHIVRDVEIIAKAARLDSGAIEYVIDSKTDQVYYCNIVALSNFVNNPVNVIGFDPTASFVDYIEDRLWPAYEREPQLLD